MTTETARQTIRELDAKRVLTAAEKRRYAQAIDVIFASIARCQRVAWCEYPEGHRDGCTPPPPGIRIAR